MRDVHAILVLLCERHLAFYKSLGKRSGLMLQVVDPLAQESIFSAKSLEREMLFRLRLRDCVLGKRSPRV